MKDKVVIITGASSGIGLASAREFAKRGARLVLAARSAEKLQEIAASLEEQGTECLAVPTDVSREEDCKQMVEKALERFGRIDILVNNAGLSMRALFRDLDLSVLKKLMDVNFWGTVYCTKYALPALLKSRGTVVGVSSVAGLHGLPARTGYSASKYAMQGFLETLRIETLKTGLHVFLLCPGFTESNVRKAALTATGEPQGESPRKEEKMMTAEEVALHLLKGIEKRRRFTVLTFEGKFTYYFKKWFPSWLDRIFYNHMAKEPDSPLKEGNREQ